MRAALRRVVDACAWWLSWPLRAYDEAHDYEAD